MKRLVSWTNVALGGYERDCQPQITKARLPSRPSAEGGVEERQRGGKDKRPAEPLQRAGDQQERGRRDGASADHRPQHLIREPQVVSDLREGHNHDDRLAEAGGDPGHTTRLRGALAFGHVVKWFSGWVAGTRFVLAARLRAGVQRVLDPSGEV
jgi:hypothetical protein